MVNLRKLLKFKSKNFDENGLPKYLLKGETGGNKVCIVLDMLISSNTGR